MSSLLDRQCAGALRLASLIIGTEEFIISGTPGKYYGAFDQLSCERELDVFDSGGGRKTTYSGTLVCALADFPREKPKLGAKVSVQGKVMRLVKLDSDTISVTLYLGNINS